MNEKNFNKYFIKNELVGKNMTNRQSILDILGNFIDEKPNIDEEIVKSGWEISFIDFLNQLKNEKDQAYIKNRINSLDIIEIHNENAKGSLIDLISRIEEMEKKYPEFNSSIIVNNEFFEELVGKSMESELETYNLLHMIKLINMKLNYFETTLETRKQIPDTLPIEKIIPSNEYPDDLLTEEELSAKMKDLIIFFIQGEFKGRHACYPKMKTRSLGSLLDIGLQVVNTIETDNIVEINRFTDYLADLDQEPFFTGIPYTNKQLRKTKYKEYEKLRNRFLETLKNASINYSNNDEIKAYKTLFELITLNFTNNCRGEKENIKMAEKIKMIFWYGTSKTDVIIEKLKPEEMVLFCKNFLKNNGFN